MRNGSAQLVALFALTGATSAFAVEPPAAPPSPPTPGLRGSGREPAAASSVEGTPPPDQPSSVPVPTEDAAGTYATPGSGEPPPAATAPTAGTHSGSSEPPSVPGSAGAAKSEDGTRAEDTEPVIVAARDTVGGHLAVGAIGGLAVPFGSIDSNVAQSDRVGPGLFLGGDITYGISRTVMIGAYGEVAMPAGQGPWSGQSVSAIGAGPMVRYHLAQGTRYDPWLAYGVGFRRMTSGNESFTGIDWARLQIGGDWYATSGLGLGPVVDLSMGTFVASSGHLDSKAVNAQLVVGLRIVFDSPGK